MLQDDFLKLDLVSDPLSGVDAVLLDPSCSGSGAAHTQLDQLLFPSGLVLNLVECLLKICANVIWLASGKGGRSPDARVTDAN